MAYRYKKYRRGSSAYSRGFRAGMRKARRKSFRSYRRR